MRHGDARGEGTIAGFTPEDIERGFRMQPYHGTDLFTMHSFTNAQEQVPVPIAVVTLYELRQLRATLDRMGRRLFKEWDE